MTQESFRNWQTRSIEQKQGASALMLGLSGAALGFSVTLLSEQTAFMGCAQSSMFHLHSIVQLVSVACGVFFSLNRVRDFDLTAQIARTRERNPNSPTLKDMRETVQRWGRITKWLYKAQGISFVIGAVSFVAFVTLRYSHVLYGP